VDTGFWFDRTSKDSGPEVREVAHLGAARGVSHPKPDPWEGSVTSPRLRGKIAAAALVALTMVVPDALAASSQDSKRPWAPQGGWKAGSAAEQPGAPAGSTRARGDSESLPPAQQNLEVLSDLELKGKFGDVVAGQIADVSVFKDTAYLMSWDEPSCTRGGTYVVDIKDVRAPKEIGFLPALPGFYHGEGAHTAAISTPQFKGDLLAVNNETYSGAGGPGACADLDTSKGGFDLYDVSDPANPKVLIQGAGDTSPTGSLAQEGGPANSYHSVFVWQDGPRAYLVGVDNTELSDIDIFDITDPKAPELINDLDALEAFPEIYPADQRTLNDEVFLHDMVVKEIDGKKVMLTSYWDSGYLQLDVSDPTKVKLITDTSFGGADPLTGLTPQEGNGHQGEFSHDNEFVLAADEDFAPFRLQTLEIADGPNAGELPATAVGGGAPPTALADGRINGPTVYGGYGCKDSAPVPQASSYQFTLEPGEEKILVLQRGPGVNSLDPDADPPVPDDPANDEESCFPGDKAAAAEAAGWDALVLVNRHLGSADDDSATCGSGGYPEGLVMPTACTTHEGLHRIFDKLPSDFAIPYDPAKEPALGDEGAKVSIEGTFDGWGYAHLYDRKTSEHLDSWAVPEALDARFATGFGDLSIHEFATDPTENLAYSAYYGAGVRVVKFSRAGGIEEVGKYIAPTGSDYWGVEQFTQGNQRYIAASDRDSGLTILRYTGPGAAAPPACTAAAVSTTRNTPVAVPLTCTDANGNTLTRRIVTGPASGTVTISGASATYTPNPGFVGSDGFTFAASDGAADSGAAAATITVAGPPAATPNPGTGTPAAPNSAFGISTRGRLSRTRTTLTTITSTQAPGTFRTTLRARIGGKTVTLGTGSRTIQKANKKVTLTTRLTAAGKRSLVRALGRSAARRVSGSIVIRFTPKGGTARTLVRAVSLR